jgi:hypothetical protein
MEVFPKRDVMKNCILSLLEKYRIAFDAADAEKIADCYHAPSVTVRGDGSFHLFDQRENVVEFMGAVARQYHDEGMANGVYSNIEIQMIGSACALVTVDWALMKDDGSMLRQWRNSYNVIKSGDECLFYVSTFHI